MNAYEPESQTQKRVRPAWIEDLQTFHSGRIARQFVLHFNITDYVIDLEEKRDTSQGKYIRLGEVVEDAGRAQQTMREYLTQFLFDELSCQYVYTYSLAIGLAGDDAVNWSREKTTKPGEREPGPAMQYLYETYASMHPAQKQGKRT